MPRGRSRSPSIMEEDRPRSRRHKRRRESDIEENPIRRPVKLEPRDDYYDSAGGPPTPPVPRDDRVHVKDEVEDIRDPPSPHFDLRVASNIIENSDDSNDTTVGSESQQSRDNSGVPNGREEVPLPGFSRVKREPGLPEEANGNINEGERIHSSPAAEGMEEGANPSAEGTEEQRKPSDEEKDDATPSASSFFNFSAAPQPDATLPYAMQSEIKHKPVTRPQVAPYYADDPVGERIYVGENGDKIRTIPLPDKGSDDSDDSEAPDDPERTQLEIENSVRVSRYFNSNEVYKKYDFKNPKVDTTRLAVFEKRNHILNSLEKGRVVIIEGFTGCGKTTQVPQYILDNCCEKDRICNIVVTQPRKIAAVSVARRVCYERNWNMGSVVGYQVGMESRLDRKDTILTFMTTGVLLQKLIGSKSLKGFTHIIIDEVHERDLESDFLLLVIKKIMLADKNQKETHVKLILMSATIDTKKFENYFVFVQNGEEIRPHVVKIPFVARHRVEEFYLDDILLTKKDQLNVIQSNMDIEKATIQEEIYDVAVSCIISMDDIERESNIDPRMRRKPSQGGKDYPKIRGAVLVFLPGMEEIKRLTRALEKEKQKKIEDPDNKHRDSNYYRWAIFPLHSSITADEQSRVFEPAGDMYRKIILSTNIAESSVTVPDIAYVIDFCLTKSLHVDKTTNFTTLQMVWAAKSQCVQRKGRAGRVADGKVYRLVPKNHYMQLRSDIEPEMKRSNLETVILMCKKFDLESPQDLLRDCMDYPQLSGIKRAVATLKELGALTVEMVDRENGGMKYVVTDGDLTFVGKVMSELPIPQQCTRLILLGHCFGVMQEAIIIAAGLSVKSPFQSGFQKQLDTYLEKMKHAKKSFSDLFALYHVYKFWMFHYCESGDVYGQRKQFNEYKWARGAMVHLAVLREIKSTVELIEERLKRLGITDSYSLPMDPNIANRIELGSERGMFLKMAIAGAFYPCYFLRRRPELKQYVKDVNKEVLGNDPFRTVYFKGFPPGHDGQLYSKHVAEYLACGLSIPSVRFDGQKALAIFDNSTGDTIGPFNTGIFRAIKLRQLRTELLEFRVLWKEDERKEVNRQEQAKLARAGVRCPPLRMLPPVDQNTLKVRVQHVISPSQFWVVIEQDFERVVSLTRFIQDHLTAIPLPPSKLFPNVLCLAPFEGTYYRAKVLRADSSRNPNAKSLVYFVDYGNSQWVSSSCLYDFSPFLREKGVANEPCMAIECRLKEMKPNIRHGLHWSDEAVEFMRRFCDKAPKLEFQIFSIYQSIMSGELLGYSDAGPGPSQRCSLNNLLLNRNDGKLFGERAPEPYLSEENNRKRLRAHLMDREEKHAAGFEQVGDPLDLDFMDPPTHGKTPVTLKGPWSPLEMSFQAMVKCSMTKEVRVENSSVNSVLLDHEPTASNSRLLIGAHVSVTQSSACMIRDSTIMPSIPGILSLVSMIFAPRAELRVDRNQCKYTGILCGCGTVPSSEEGFVTVHPENDMEIVFDTVIDDQDVNQINIIRYNLNLILRNSRGVNKSEYHKRLREEVIKLLLRARGTITEEVWAPEEHVWNRVSPEFLVTSMNLGMTFNHEDIFQPHRRVMLNRMEEEEVRWDGGY